SGHKFGCGLLQVHGAVLGSAALDDDVAALDVAELTQPLAKRPRHHAIDSKRCEISDAMDLPCLLRVGGERRGEHGSQSSDERAAVNRLVLTAGDATRFRGRITALTCRGSVGQSRAVRAR